MTASRIAHASPPAQWVTSPIIDYEPVPQTLAAQHADASCPMPGGVALHRASLRPLRSRRVATRPLEQAPPKSAVVFAETALRQVMEVIDRRRPVAQLRPLMTPVLVDRVLAQAGAARRGSAAMRRVRVRAVDTGIVGETTAAEVFASFTRAGRVHAIAARIERYKDAWRLVALEIG